MPAARLGTQECGGSRRRRTWSRSSPGSAPSFIATTGPISPASCGRPSPCSAPSAACSARTSRSRSCGPATPTWSRPMRPPSRRSARPRGGRSSKTPPRASIAWPLPRRQAEGRPSMPLEIKVLDYGDIELESSFLVLGRDCGRTRRVATLGFLILGGTYPIVVDTGYRSNQIMETLGMRGLHFHENMIETHPARHGVRMGDVRFVLHTHLHIDHAGKDDLFPMNTTVVLHRREMEYSVSGLMHPQYPLPDIKHLVDRLHTKDALRLEDLEISGPTEIIPGV